MSMMFNAPVGVIDQYAQALRRIDKPWGYEIVWALTSDYCGKILFVEAGHRLICSSTVGRTRRSTFIPALPRFTSEIPRKLSVQRRSARSVVPYPAGSHPSHRSDRGLAPVRGLYTAPRRRGEDRGCIRAWW